MMREGGARDHETKAGVCVLGRGELSTSPANPAATEAGRVYAQGVVQLLKLRFMGTYRLVCLS